MALGTASFPPYPAGFAALRISDHRPEVHASQVEYTELAVDMIVWKLARTAPLHQRNGGSIHVILRSPRAGPDGHVGAVDDVAEMIARFLAWPTPFLILISPKTMLHVVLGARRSGIVIAVGIAVAFFALAVAAYGGLDWLESWSLYGVPTMLPPFLDLHGVTDNASCAAQGIDVYLYRHCDVLHRGYNYPPIWLLLGKFGIDGGDTPWLAIVVVLPALGLMIVLLSGRSIGMGLIALLAVLSSSVMLGVERGNIDLIEWSFVCAAALLFSGRRASRMISLSLVLLMFAVVLKLIAVFCCSLIVRLRRAEIIISGVLYRLHS